MALSRHNATIRPMSVQEIVEQAEDFEFSTSRPLQSWLRSAKMLLTEAAICEQDGNLQMAYLYLYRHAELILSRLPTHPDFKDPMYKHEISRARKAVQKNFTQLERWKPRIERDHQRYLNALARRDAEKQRAYDGNKAAERDSFSHEQSGRRSATPEHDLFGDVGQAISAVENNQLAVDFAREELRRRDLTRQAAREKHESFGRSSPKHAPASPRQLAHGLHSGFDKMHDGVREVGRHLHHRRGSRDYSTASEGTKASSSYNYPSVPRTGSPMSWDQTSLPPPQRPAKDAYDSPPALPSKVLSLDTHSLTLPPKVLDSTTPSPQTATPSPPTRPAMPASRYTFKPTAFTEAGLPLRTVLLPPELRTTFMNLAHPNTLRNVETCGILCGTLISNALFINHLVIPDQTSTSDTCDTTEEGDNALFDYCDSKDLLVCGWIHTHPSQSCFLSSRDLHTSSGYQIMLPEAIAIVCAPRHTPDWGIFRLTDPPGLPHVLECHKPGIFHPHDIRNIYTDALRPGHVVEGAGLAFDVVDLRPKSRT